MQHCTNIDSSENFLQQMTSRQWWPAEAEFIAQASRAATAAKENVDADAPCAEGAGTCYADCWQDVEWGLASLIVDIRSTRNTLLPGLVSAGSIFSADTSNALRKLEAAAQPSLGSIQTLVSSSTQAAGLPIATSRPGPVEHGHSDTGSTSSAHGLVGELPRTSVNAQLILADDAAGGTGGDEFEVWMRQDARFATTPAFLASQGMLDGGYLPPTQDGVATEASTSSLVTRLMDVGVGDLVVVKPLFLRVATAGSEQCSPASSSPLVASNRGGSQRQPSDCLQRQPHPTAQGVVDELLLDDPVQPSGVLVRLAGDNVVGHVLQVLSHGHRQRQEAWPQLPAFAQQQPSTASSQDGRSGSKQPGAGGNKHSHPAQNTASVKVIRANGLGFTVGQRQRGVNATPNDVRRDLEALQASEWEALQRHYGAAICQAVLDGPECGGRLADAIRVMQAGVMSMGYMVQHH
jgi:hypothetical protein